MATPSRGLILAPAGDDLVHGDSPAYREGEGANDFGGARVRNETAVVSAFE